MAKKKKKALPKKVKTINIPIKSKPARLVPLKFGLAAGILAAACLIVTTILFASTGIGSMWVSLMADVYGFLGYQPTPIGTILGAIYGFIDTFIITAVFAWLYNKLI